MFLLTNKQFSNKKIITNSKPVLITGLLFIALCHQLTDAQISLSLLTDNLLTNPKPPAATDTINTCALQYTYAPLLNEIKTNGSDNYNSNVLVHSGQSSILWCNNRSKYLLSYSFTDFKAAYRDDTERYSFDNTQKQHTPYVSALFTINNTDVGLLLGRHFSKGLDIEHRYEITDAFGRYLSDGPWIYSLSAKQNIDKMNLGLSLFSGPVYSSVSRMVTRSSRSFRTFPVSLINRTCDLTLDYRDDDLCLSLNFQGSSWHTADLLETSNSMPQDIEFRRYRVSRSMCVSVPFSDSLYWSANGSMIRGHITSYNFTRNKLTFFKADSIRIKSVSVLGGLALSRKSCAELSGDFTTFSSPAGLLRLSALSAWSIFRPLDYKYTDVNGDYTELGIHLHRTMHYKKFSFVPSLSCSYIKAAMNLTHMKKEIVVLIPIYGDTVCVEPVNKRLIVLTPEITTNATIGHYAFQFKATQLIPIELKKIKQSSGGEPIDNSGEKRSPRFWGGTSLSFFVNYYFGR